MVKLRTLLTVFTFILKAKACDYGKGRYISDSCLWCSANHNALGQFQHLFGFDMSIVLKLCDLNHISLTP